MRQLFFIATIIILTRQVSAGQSIQQYELYNYVDSVIVHVLKYRPDSITTDLKIDTRPKTGLERSVSSLPRNPEPLILLDGIEVNKAELKQIDFDKIQKIEILTNDNKQATAVFGQRAANGIIILTTKEFEKKKN